MWLSITIVTLDRNPFHFVKKRCPERACDDTCLASDAFILVDQHPLMLQIFMTCLRRTDLHAEGLLAVLTGGRKIEPYVLPLHDLDP